MSEPVYRELPVWKRVLVAAWLRWERVFARLYRIEELPGEISMFRVSLRPYPGKDTTLPNGSMLRRGDPTAELHFNNDFLVHVNRMASEARMGIALIRGASQSLHRVADYILADRRYDSIKALWGVTLLYRGAERFGFDVRDPGTWFASKWLSIYLHLLLWIFHPDGGRRLRQRADLLKPQLVFVSRDDFLRHVEDDRAKSSGRSRARDDAE